MSAEFYEKHTSMSAEFFEKHTSMSAAGLVKPCQIATSAEVKNSWPAVIYGSMKCETDGKVKNGGVRCYICGKICNFAGNNSVVRVRCFF